MSFGEYLTHVRMDKAKELLRQPDKDLEEIAAAVGCRDIHHFNMLFVKAQECSAEEYRNMKA